MSYLCNRCSGWVHSKCSGLQNAAEYRRIKDWVCSSCSSPTVLPTSQPPSGSVYKSRGDNVGAVEEMMCVVCVDVTDGA